MKHVWYSRYYRRFLHGVIYCETKGRRGEEERKKGKGRKKEGERKRERREIEERMRGGREKGMMGNREWEKDKRQ